MEKHFKQTTSVNNCNMAQENWILDAYFLCSVFWKYF